MTDVTGFGLLGHALEMARGRGATLAIDDGAVPLLAQAEALARAGFVTGASGRNWASYGAEVALPAEMPDWRRQLLTDPQTSGGLLVACAPGRGRRAGRRDQGGRAIRWREPDRRRRGGRAGSVRVVGLRRDSFGQKLHLRPRNRRYNWLLIQTSGSPTQPSCQGGPP